MRELKIGTAANVMLWLADVNDHVTGKAGATGITFEISRNGAAFETISGAFYDRGNGWYSLVLNASYIDTLGDLVVRMTATGADPAERVLNVVANVEADTKAVADALPAALSSAHGAGAWGSGQEGIHKVSIKMVNATSTAKIVTGATKANPCKLTIPGHGLTTGGKGLVTGIGGMVELNNRVYTATVIDADNITIGVDSTAYTAYTTGGRIEKTSETAVQNLHIAVYDSTDTNLITTLETDGTGIGMQGVNAYALLNPGTYKLRPRMGGFNATGDYTLTVTGDHLGASAKVFSGTILATPIPGDPDACTLVADLISFGLAPKAGIKLSAVVKSPPQVSSDNQIIDAEPWETTTGIDGRATLVLPQGIVWVVDFAPLTTPVEIDTKGKSTLNLADVVKTMNAGGI